MGAELACNQEWLDTISAYLAEVVAIGNALRPWPSRLRSLIRPFLAPRYKMDAIISKAQKVLLPAIRIRQAADHTPTDLLGFLSQSSDALKPISVILKLLVLTSAAVSFTTFSSRSQLTKEVTHFNHGSSSHLI